VTDGPAPWRPGADPTCRFPAGGLKGRKGRPSGGASRHWNHPGDWRATAISPAISPSSSPARGSRSVSARRWSFFALSHRPFHRLAGASTGGEAGKKVQPEIARRPGWFRNLPAGSWSQCGVSPGRGHEPPALEADRATHGRESSTGPGRFPGGGGTGHLGGLATLRIAWRLWRPVQQTDIPGIDRSTSGAFNDGPWICAARPGGQAARRRARRPFPRRLSRSDCTICRTSSLNPHSGTQPSFSRALVGSASSRSTSAGR
jgi:hypothetical protein